MNRLYYTLISCLLALPASASYLIQAGDTLRLEILEDPELNRNLLVLPDGTISVPMAGVLQASGRSVSQVQSQVLGAISDRYARPPSVTISVARLAPKPVTQRVARVAPQAPPPAAPVAPATITIYAMGEISKTGVLEVQPGSNLLQVVAQAGGLTRFAAPKRILLHRKVEGAQRSYRLNMRQPGLAGRVILRAGDVIEVPERRLFE